MRHLKTVYISGLAFDPVALSDGTLLFLHRHPERGATLVIPADDIYEYVLTESTEYATMAIPIDKDADKELQKAFPECGIDTNFIFGSQAARAYDDGELFPEDDEEDEEDGAPRRPRTLAEFEDAANEHEGTFVHRTWNTKAEADAYAQGINDMYDWMGYATVEKEHITTEEKQ